MAAVHPPNELKSDNKFISLMWNIYAGDPLNLKYSGYACWQHKYSIIISPPFQTVQSPFTTMNTRLNHYPEFITSAFCQQQFSSNVNFFILELCYCDLVFFWTDISGPNIDHQSIYRCTYTSVTQLSIVSPKKIPTGTTSLRILCKTQVCLPWIAWLVKFMLSFIDMYGIEFHISYIRTWW